MSDLRTQGWSWNPGANMGSHVQSVLCEKSGREAAKKSPDPETAIRSFFPDSLGKQDTAWCEQKATPNAHGAF